MSFPEADLLRAVYRAGTLSLPRSFIPFVTSFKKALFDTGALHGSYISSSFVSSHANILSPYIRPLDSAVTLADNRTSIKIEGVISLLISFVDDDNHLHSASISLFIFPMTQQDVIIGLPHILCHFGALFLSMLNSSVSVTGGAPATLSHLPSSPSSSRVPSYLLPTREPWSTELLAIAPEEEQAPEPCNFSFALHFMEMSHEDALNEYFSLFDKHVHPDFASATSVLSLLRTKGSKVFVPSNWTGIKIPPIELQWKPGLPDSIKPKARPINPKLFDSAKTEFQRLRQYFYAPSDSPIASCLVIAPKATKPFIRICGDYSPINKYIHIPHETIPQVQHELSKMLRFKVFLDLDWKLDLILDRCIERNVFLKFSKSWLGFDHANFFGYVCRHGRYELSQERKQAVSSIPFPSTLKRMQQFLGAALFFRHFIPHYSTLTAPLNDMLRADFPWTTRSLWPKDYPAHFDSFKSALLDAHTLYLPDYELDWVLRTDASLVGVGAVLFQLAPQVATDTMIYQPIGFASQKFSPPATRWTTIEQECFGLYFGVSTFSHYLRGKRFTLETDHSNLLWIEQSTVPKIMRWRVYLQGFTFFLRHIPGKTNLLADYLSRMWDESDPPLPTTALNAIPIHRTWLPDPVVDPNRTLEDPQRVEDLPKAFPSDDVPPTVNSPFVDVHSPDPLQAEVASASSTDDILRLVHNSRAGHHGLARTWRRLQDMFPGHSISHQMVMDFIARCPVCQKIRTVTDNTLPSVVRHLKPLHHRAIVGVDTLTVTPADSQGNQYLIVVVSHDSKLAALYPAKQHDANSVATALFQFFCTYGVFDSIITDPGTEFDNEVLRCLLGFLGIHHRISLVARHQSNGVERTNATILRHLRAIVADERIANRWSDPTVLPLIQFFLNSAVHSETGFVPFHVHFGTPDATYMRMPDTWDPSIRANSFLRLLDDNLRAVREASHAFQSNLIAQRTAANPHDDEQVKFQPGDYVLVSYPPESRPPSKLHARHVGPLVVVQHERNDVTVRSLIDSAVSVVHVSRLRIFHGSSDDAFKSAQLDADQYLIDRFVAFRGDPNARQTMEFLVLFADRSEVWLPWSTDLTTTVHFEDFCRARPCLSLLVYTQREAQRRLADLRRTPLAEDLVGQHVYVDLRSYGAAWYATLTLPALHRRDYLVRYVYGQKTSRFKIHVSCPLWAETFCVDHAFVWQYGSHLVTTPLDPHQTIVTAALCLQYPDILPSATRHKLIARLRTLSPTAT
eukprot:gene11569-12955_t